jgi:hypothetical protein
VALWERLTARLFDYLPVDKTEMKISLGVGEMLKQQFEIPQDEDEVESVESEESEMSPYEYKLLRGMFLY